MSPGNLRRVHLLDQGDALFHEKLQKLSMAEMIATFDSVNARNYTGLEDFIAEVVGSVLAGEIVRRQSCEEER